MTRDIRDVVAFLRKRAKARAQSALRATGLDVAVMTAESVELSCAADAIEAGEYVGASGESSDA
jgi:hypothetical protein